MLDGFRLCFQTAVTSSSRKRPPPIDRRWNGSPPQLNQRMLDESENSASGNPVSSIEHQVSSETWRVVAARKLSPRDRSALYRFLNYSMCQTFLESRTHCTRMPKVAVKYTPPIKPYIEEKMWFALFGCSHCVNFGDADSATDVSSTCGSDPLFVATQSDPFAPTCGHSILEIHDWHEAARFSQKDRDLLLKVSGFSPLRWGSRGIAIGGDFPHAEWEKRINHSLETFESSPTIMQHFHKDQLMRTVRVLGSGF